MKKVVLSALLALLVSGAGVVLFAGNSSTSQKSDCCEVGAPCCPNGACCVK